MYNKRDRMVALYWHRSTDNVLLFPYVFHMGGCGTAYGDAVELAAVVEPKHLGKQLITLLRECKKADLDELKAEHMQRLRAFWRGETLTREKVQGAVWNQLLVTYPSLRKGPGTFLRQFPVCEVCERDGGKYRKLVRVEPSRHRGATESGETLRVPVTHSPQRLGKQILEFLAQ